MSVMKVTVKGFPKFFYCNERTGTSTKSRPIAELWFLELGDNVAVCSNITGEVLDTWKHERGGC